MTPKLASTGQTSTNQCLHVVVWIFAHKISLNWNRFHHVNLAIIALLVNLIFRFYNGSVWQTGRVWATILVPMEFFQPTLSFETKNSIFLSDGDTLNSSVDCIASKNHVNRTRKLKTRPLPCSFDHLVGSFSIWSHRERAPPFQHHSSRVYYLSRG